MTPITIPAEILDDARKRPEAYRPEVEVGQTLLILRSYSRCVGRVGEALHRPIPGVSLSAAPAGQEDEGWEIDSWSPIDTRPDVGARVLILDGAPAAVGRIGVWRGLKPGNGMSNALLVDIGGLNAYASSWAILPPAPEPTAAHTSRLTALNGGAL